MQAKRIKWKELKLAIEHWKLVFLDESGVNIGMTRRYGRAIGKARVHGSAPLNVPTSQTVLASVRLNGQITYTMYPGGTSGERFLDYLKNVLIPTLHKGDIVVMENMRSHHVKGVEEVLRAAGMIPLYLPTYSPDLNPIEMLWSKMKAILRKLGCNIAALLPQMVAEALALVSPEDCLFCECIQSILNVLDSLRDVCAKAVNHRLIFFFPRCIFFQHSEKKINIKRRPNSLLQRRFHDGLNIRFHGVPPFSRRKKAYKKAPWVCVTLFGTRKATRSPERLCCTLVEYEIERLLLMTTCCSLRRTAGIPAGVCRK